MFPPPLLVSFSTFREGIHGNRAAPADLLAPFEGLAPARVFPIESCGDLLRSFTDLLLCSSPSLFLRLQARRSGLVQRRSFRSSISSFGRGSLRISLDARDAIQVRLGLLLSETMRRLG